MFSRGTRTLVLVVCWVAALAAPHAAGARPTDGTLRLFEALHDRVDVLEADLGAERLRPIRDAVQSAESDYLADLRCRAVTTLNDVHHGAKQFRALGFVAEVESLGDARETLQLAMLREELAEGRDPCGVRLPTFAVDPNLRPSRTSVRPLADGVVRPVARLAWSDGALEFVENELVVQTSDQAQLLGLLTRTRGVVVNVIEPPRVGTWGPPTYVVRVNPATGNVRTLAGDLRAIDPRATGDFRASSDAGLRLLALAAGEYRTGLVAVPNVIASGDLHETRFVDRETEEAAAKAGSSGPAYSPNAFDWPYMRADGQKIAVGEAWRVLELAGKLTKKTRIAIIDDGYVSNADVPPNSTGGTGIAGDGTCGGSSCPWHGANVASAAAAVPDNAFGAAGPAGPVGELMMISYDHTQSSAIDGIYEAFEGGARIINISSGSAADAAVHWLQVPYEDATQTARENGVLVVASAGNAGLDVDAEDCFIACWEEEWKAPCENDGVVCVGGLDDASLWRAGNSNYGFEWCGASPCDVDIFAPYRVWIGPDGAATGNAARWLGGTSFSAPFVAGVAALVWSAKPSLTDDQVEHVLMKWAHVSPDPLVGRYVNALSSVKKGALGGNVPPMVGIVAPADAASVQYGGFNEVALVATTVDYEQGEGCCTVTWSSDVEGALGAGHTRKVTFGEPGKRTITATVTDAKGAKRSESIILYVVNAAPSLDIAFPTHGQVLYRGWSYAFQAFVSDVNEPAFPCSSVSWDTDVILDGSLWFGGSFPAKGCQPIVTFGSTGTRTLTVRVTDAHGGMSIHSLKVNVVEPPADAPPSVLIVSPSDGAFLDPAKEVTLQGEVQGVPDHEVTSATWSVIYGATTKIIGSGLDLQWTPGEDVPFKCGGRAITLRLQAKTENGEAQDEISAWVGYPPC